MPLEPRVTGLHKTKVDSLRKTGEKRTHGGVLRLAWSHTKEDSRTARNERNPNKQREVARGGAYEEVTFILTSDLSEGPVTQGANHA